MRAMICAAMRQTIASKYPDQSFSSSSGYGLFKSNISCLLGELYDENDHRRDGGFSLLYAAGNIGSIAAPIACGLAAQWYGWHVGFALAGGGMFIGLLIFLSGHRHFQSTRSMDKKAPSRR